MPLHLNPNDPNCKNAAAEILRRHDKGEPEANITTAVRNFLTVTGLVKHEEIVEENPPAEGSRRAVDLTAKTAAERTRPGDSHHSPPGTAQVAAPVGRRAGGG